MQLQRQIQRHQQALARCRRCKNMVPPVVMGQPVVSEVMLVGQAPGQQAVVGKHRLARLGTVRVECLFGFLADIHRLRRGHLHPVNWIVLLLLLLLL